MEIHSYLDEMKIEYYIFSEILKVPTLSQKEWEENLRIRKIAGKDNYNCFLKHRRRNIEEPNETREEIIDCYISFNYYLATIVPNCIEKLPPKSQINRVVNALLSKYATIEDMLVDLKNDKSFTEIPGVGLKIDSSIRTSLIHKYIMNFTSFDELEETKRKNFNKF